jgi:ribosome maturation protein SDO1
MVNIDEAVIARLKKEGETFEVLVDCDKALEFRAGNAPLADALATTEIFKDVKKAEHASENEMQELFHTSDPHEVAAIIIKEGDIQLTTEHKNKLREEKRKQIVNLIHRNTVDSKTGFPHPPQRIESAMDEVKVKVDEVRSAEEQMHDVISSLRELLPIKMEKREIAIKVPAQHAGKAYGSLKALGRFLKDEWLSDGSLVLVIEIPAGIQEEVENTANKLAQGEAEIKVLKKF